MKRKRKKVEERSLARNWQIRRKDAGDCPGCADESLDFNPRTGKPYALGPQCRKAKAETQKLLMRERRRAGLAE